MEALLKYLQTGRLPITSLQAESRVVTPPAPVVTTSLPSQSKPKAARRTKSNTSANTQAEICTSDIATDAQTAEGKIIIYHCFFSFYNVSVRVNASIGGRFCFFASYCARWMTATQLRYILFLWNMVLQLQP